jgi:replicative DNA helicase
LRGLAKDLDLPVVSLSQLNRKCEERQDKRPVQSDLRDSGNIEQDAYTIVFLYRDEYYNPNSKRKNEVDIIVAKQRGGATGTVTAMFDRTRTRFFDRPISHYPSRSGKQ